VTAVLTAQSLTRRFNDIVAVDHVTLAVAQGEMFGLLGGNGAGKSMLIKMLKTLLPPTSGSATVAGFDIVRELAQVRRVIGYVTKYSFTAPETTWKLRKRTVKPPMSGKAPSASADSPMHDASPRWSVAPLRYVAKVFAIVHLEIRKLRHDPVELLTRAIQPMLWLAVFGQTFAHAHAMPTGTLDYVDIPAPGVLARSVLFVAIFYGISMIWERGLGIVHEFLVCLAPRAALVRGSALSASIGLSSLSERRLA